MQRDLNTINGISAVGRISAIVPIKCRKMQRGAREHRSPPAAEEEEEEGRRVRVTLVENARLMRYI